MRFQSAPSLITSRNIAAAAILFFVLLYSSISLWDPDFWWHINTGRYILEHKALPDEDPFSFTPPAKNERRNTLVLKGYWLGQIVLYKVYEAVGVSGTILFRTFLLALTLFLVWRFVRNGNTYLALANLLLAGNILFYFTGERPQTLVFPLAVLMFVVIQGYLGGEKGKAVIFLPLITLIWANIHASVLFAMAVIALYMISVLLFSKDATPTKKVSFAAVCLFSILAAFLSPMKETLVTGFADFQRSIIRSESVEFFSPFKLLTAYGKFYPGYWICILATTYLLLTNTRVVPLSTTLILALSSLLSLTGARYMVFYALSTPLLFRLPQLKANGYVRTAVLALSIVPVLLNLGYFTPFNFSIRETFPAQSTHILKDREPRKVFTYLEWGGFVAYHLPGTKTFIDGRMLNAETLMQYEITIEGTEVMGQKEWKANLDRYNVDAVLLPPRDFNTGAPVGLIARLSNDGEWERIYHSETEVLFIRKAR